MRKAIGLFCLIFAVSCSTNRHKAEKLDTNLAGGEQVSGAQKVGLKAGEMVVQGKVEMREKLRDLQNEVFALEDKVYGNRKFDSKGLYGELRSCKSKLASRQYGGSGTLVWAEPLDRVTDKEEDMQMGLDENNQLVGVQEEYLKDRYNRFLGYKRILQKREDEFNEDLANCRAQMKDKEIDTAATAKRVSVTEIDKISLEKDEVNSYLCGFVKSGAPLSQLLMNAFGHGWMSVSEFPPERNLLSGTIRNDRGEEKEGGMMVGSWRLAFAGGPVTLNELLSGAKDAKLQAWSGTQQCLAKNDGRWNP
jgi:hypothetical protein